MNYYTHQMGQSITMGCFKIECTGFVQTNRHVEIGGVLDEGSMMSILIYQVSTVINNTVILLLAFDQLSPVTYLLYDDHF